jgi:TM2 domain-containing membrane protein YozV
MRKLTISCLALLLIVAIIPAGAESAGKSLVRLEDESDGRLLSYQASPTRTVTGGVGSSARYLASEEPDDFFQMPGEFDETKKGMKSTAKAALLSLVLPGAGEIYGGSQTKGKIFILSEASVWAGFFAFRTYGSWLEDDYTVYAAARAKVNLDGKSDSFFDQLAFYDSRDQYNQFALLYYRGERQPYPEDDFWYWAWDSRESRAHYRDLKNRSKDASRRALYMVGLSLVNRIVSVVDAMKTVQSYNRKKSLQLSRMKFDLKANPLGHNPKVMLYVSRNW